MSASRTNQATSLVAPLGSVWWREPTMWLVVSGPLSVVVACVVTAFYVMDNPDVPLALTEVRANAQRPALQGRNHAATDAAGSAGTAASETGTQKR